MKKPFLLPLAALSISGAFLLSACGESTSSTVTTDTFKQGATLNAGMDMNNASAGSAGSGSTAQLSTTDEYTDLNSGRSMRLRRDDAGGTYRWEDGSEPTLYVNNSTRDTFYGTAGQLVNGYLIHRGNTWSLDELRVERNGEGFKAKSEDGEVKIKSNENELKMKNGDEKLKMNEDEMKYKDKDAGIKVKSNENGTKIKTPDSKTKIDEDGNVTTKPR